LPQDVRFCPSCGQPAHDTAQVTTPDADVDVPPPPEDRKDWKDKLRGDNEPDWLDRMIYGKPEPEPRPEPDERRRAVEPDERIPPRQNDAGQRMMAAGCSMMLVGLVITVGIVILVALIAVL
jgi:hypothetical protein